MKLTLEEVKEWKRLHPDVDETWKKARKIPPHFVYKRGRFGTTIVYRPPEARIIGRCPKDRLPLYTRGKSLIFCKNHKWELQHEKKKLEGQIVGFSPLGGPLLFYTDLADKNGNWWKLQ